LVEVSGTVCVPLTYQAHETGATTMKKITAALLIALSSASASSVAKDGLLVD
jgi:hypothetical protein